MFDRFSLESHLKVPRMPIECGKDKERKEKDTTNSPEVNRFKCFLALREIFSRMNKLRAELSGSERKK